MFENYKRNHLKGKMECKKCDMLVSNMKIHDDWHKRLKEH